jgi:type IV pilus assembly protein PilB
MPSKKKLGQMLLEAGLINEGTLAQALEEQKKSGGKLGKILIRKNFIKEQDLVNSLSRQLGIEKFSPYIHPLDLNVQSLIPLDFAQKNLICPIRKKGRLLTVALCDPLDITLLDTVETLTNLEIEPLVATEREINQLLNTLFGSQAGLSSLIDSIEIEPLAGKPKETTEEDLSLSALEGMAEEAPVIRLVNSIFEQAIKENASDVHISPQQNSVQVRFRIDGKMHDVPSPPKSLFLPIVARIKILANLDITTTRVPQDGRFTLKKDNKEINLRVSCLPTIFGENVVLRLLNVNADIYTLDALGMDPDDIAKINAAMEKPYGLILSTGPTGSGKTTSLYSILNLLNRPDRNIITLEDPVEYRIERVRQVQLNPKAGMNFADSLRSILRQDPDVIMVGEIRDVDTARVAVQAGMTGHRVLSTLHTNDAAGTPVRMVDMGVEPFLVASVLLVAFAQRLVRTICPYCVETYVPTEASLRSWGLEPDSDWEFKRGKGCFHCLDTGYKGRTGIFEVLSNDPEIQALIVKSASAREIDRVARETGKLRTLREDALGKVRRGITTLEEAATAVML